ncbi:MAG: helix-turn-helix domain-containing protein [Solirubrobacteraceae bacterium]
MDVSKPCLLDVLASEVASLGDSELDCYAEKLAPLVDHIRARSETIEPRVTVPDRWLDSRQAAEYLGLSRNALHRLTASRKIPFEQDGPGCKCWFRVSALDAWRRGEDGPDASPETRFIA